MEIQHLTSKYTNYLSPIDPSFKRCSNLVRMSVEDRSVLELERNETVLSGFKCFNKNPADPTVCSGNGECVDQDQCKCYSGFKGHLCQTVDTNAPTCAGKRAYDHTVCDGRGQCIGKDDCKCNPPFVSMGGKCNPFVSLAHINFDDEPTKNPKECFGKGDWKNGKCVCKNPYSGKYCQIQNAKSGLKIEFNFQCFFELDLTHQMFVLKMENVLEKIFAFVKKDILEIIVILHCARMLKLQIQMPVMEEVNVFSQINADVMQGGLEFLVKHHLLHVKVFMPLIGKSVEE